MNSAISNSPIDKAPIMICFACKQKTCYTHDVPWHEGRTCAQYDLEKATTEGATIDAINRETKPCPKCQIRIFKNGLKHVIDFTLNYPFYLMFLSFYIGGCSHMTCTTSGCGYEFCWL